MVSHTIETLARAMHAAYNEWLVANGYGVCAVGFDLIEPDRRDAYRSVAAKVIGEHDTLQSIRGRARVAQDRFAAIARRFAGRVVDAVPADGPPMPVAVDSPALRQLRRLVGLYLAQNHNARVAEMERVLEIPADQLKAVLNCDWFTEKAGVWGLTPEGNRNVG